MAISLQQLHNMQHAVGFFSNNPGYRNRYAAESGLELWDDLIEQGLAVHSGASGSMQFFSLTEKGKQAIGLPQQIEFKQGCENQRKRTAMGFLQELVNCGAYEADDVECHGYTMEEVVDFDPCD